VTRGRQNVEMDGCKLLVLQDEKVMKSNRALYNNVNGLTLLNSVL
jgi:hypothetical protein